jgi:hypothetical protein
VLPARGRPDFSDSTCDIRTSDARRYFLRARNPTLGSESAIQINRVQKSDAVAMNGTADPITRSITTAHDTWNENVKQQHAKPLLRSERGVVNLNSIVEA